MTTVSTSDVATLTDQSQSSSQDTLYATTNSSLIDNSDSTDSNIHLFLFL